MDDDLWRSLLPGFLDFCNRWCIPSNFTIFPPLPETGCPMGHPRLTIDHWVRNAAITITELSLAMALVIADSKMFDESLVVLLRLKWKFANPQGGMDLGDDMFRWLNFYCRWYFHLCESKSQWRTINVMGMTLAGYDHSMMEYDLVVTGMIPNYLHARRKAHEKNKSMPASEEQECPKNDSCNNGGRKNCKPKVPCCLACSWMASRRQPQLKPFCLGVGHDCGIDTVADVRKALPGMGGYRMRNKPRSWFHKKRAYPFVA